MDQAVSTILAQQVPMPGEVDFVSYDTKSVAGEIFDVATLKQFGALTEAYDFFVRNLFNNNLPSVILTLNRVSRAMGYYMPSAWKEGEATPIPEININPDILALPPIEVMSTLVHEICHHYQYVFGKPGRGNYHNREFAKMMYSIGLKCSQTGKPGGKATGEPMSHYIVEGGRFENTFNAMPEEYLLPFKSTNSQRSKNPASHKKNKSKYLCPTCGSTVWGKPNLNIVCGDCNVAYL